jgi:hypothetical protein
MKTVLKKLLVFVAIPVSLVVVLWVFLRGGGCGPVVCDPVHPGTRPADPSTRPGADANAPQTQPRPDPNRLPPVCDPVHLPPEK